MMNNNQIEKIWNKKREKIYKGKSYFEKTIDITTMTDEDTVLLLLTDNELCIDASIKYLPMYMKQFHKKRVYFFTSCDKVVDKFNIKNIKIIKVLEEELEEIAVYLSLFDIRNQVVYLCENDRWGAKVEHFLKHGFFNLDEYVALGIYELKSYL